MLAITLIRTKNNTSDQHFPSLMKQMVPPIVLDFKEAPNVLTAMVAKGDPFCRDSVGYSPLRGDPSYFSADSWAAHPL